MKKILYVTAVLLVIGCGSAFAKDKKMGSETLWDIEWKLTEVKIGENSFKLDRTAMKDDRAQDYTITFSEKGINGRAYPNRYFSGYEINKGSNMIFKPIAGTLMAAFNEPYPIKENEYYNYLKAVKSWSLKNGILSLSGILEDGKKVVLFFSK
ncbi:MAG: hypothetical protein Ta2B_20660 [Termitinemataceae bacterium]|nr:MAG: hypothetical protein Ta2B_20660 [Termitinemataceae bacterium]